MGLSLGKICSLADWVGLIQSIQPEEADDPDLKKASYYLHVRVLRRPVIRPDVQLLRLAIVAEGGD